MLMQLVWAVFGVPISLLLGLLPEAPEPVSITLPWPDAVPSALFVGALLLCLAAGTLVLALKFLRWVYGLIPVV